MTTVHVMVGVAGSGKSTYVKEEIEGNNKAIRLSSDYIREAIPEIKDDNSEVFRVMNNALKMHIKDGYFKDIYYDATNITRKRRRALYRNIKSWNKEAEVIIVFFSVPYFEVLKRNNKRKKDERVPENVILRMHRQLQVPRIDVDCDEIIVKGIPIFERWSDDMESPNRVEDIFNYMNSDWVPEISLSNTEHDTPWHLESIFEHIQMTIDNSKTSRMKRIAWWHDLGKGVCKTKKGDRSVYLGHADVSAHYFLNYLYLTKKKILKEDLEDLEVIKIHMNAHQGLGDKNIRNNKLTDKVIMISEEFAKIDNESRVTSEEVLDI